MKSATVAAQIQVQADEIAAPGATGPLVGGLSGSVLFNPEGTAFDLAPPDGGTDPDTAEVYSPSISSANVSNANVSNSSLANVSNANVSNANVSNANVSNAHVANFDLADANVSNANVSNANVSNANVSNANVSNANISNAPVSDATFTVVNDGNTTHSYHVKLVGQAPAPTTALQLIIQKPYATPTGLGCELVVEPHNALVTNIVNPTIGDPDGLFDPNIPDSSLSNATVVLEPGQSASVTLRGAVEAADMVKIANRVFPRIIAHAGNSTPNEPYADPLVIASESATLPGAVLGVPYNATLQATGGKPPFNYTWSLAPGSPPCPQSQPVGGRRGLGHAAGRGPRGDHGCGPGPGHEHRTEGHPGADFRGGRPGHHDQRDPCLGQRGGGTDRELHGHGGRPALGDAISSDGNGHARRHLGSDRPALGLHLPFARSSHPDLHRRGDCQRSGRRFHHGHLRG